MTSGQVLLLQPSSDYGERELVGIHPEDIISRGFELKEFKLSPVQMTIQADILIVSIDCLGSATDLDQGPS